jgi:hypothetical protein
MRTRPRLRILLLLAAAAIGCGGFHPVPIDQTDLLERT